MTYIFNSFNPQNNPLGKYYLYFRNGKLWDWEVKYVTQQAGAWVKVRAQACLTPKPCSFSCIITFWDTFPRNNALVSFLLLTFQWLCVHQEEGQGARNSFLHPFLSNSGLFSLQSLLYHWLVPHPLWPPKSLEHHLSLASLDWLLTEPPAKLKMFHSSFQYPFSLATAHLIHVNPIPISFIPFIYWWSPFEPLYITPWLLKTFFPHSFSKDTLS